MKELYGGSIKVPEGEAEIRAYYGDIRLERVNGSMCVLPKEWEERNCVVVRDFPGLDGRPLYVHRLIIEPLRAALTEAQIVCPEYRIRTIGCFNPRLSRHGGRMSLHAWAVAVDINADTNPMRNPLMTDMPPEFIDAFRRVGWKWGGEFSTADPQHYQLATGW